MHVEMYSDRDGVEMMKVVEEEVDLGSELGDGEAVRIDRS